MKLKKGKNKGFTLVELIIVVAVIAVLASVLAPQYLKYVERTREANDVQVATSLMRAASVAVLDPQNTAIIPGYYYVFEWRTGEDIEGLRNSSVIRMGEASKGSGGEGITANAYTYNETPPASDNWAAAEGRFARDICNVMGWTRTVSSQGTVNVGDAESEAGNEMNFRFAINSETTEIIILDETGNYNPDNPWIAKLGLDSAVR